MTTSKQQQMMDQYHFHMLHYSNDLFIYFVFSARQFSSVLCYRFNIVICVD